MAKLVNKTEVRRASEKDIIDAQIILANALAEKEENRIDYDSEQVLGAVLAKDDIYTNTDLMNEVYIVGNLIAIPSKPPRKGADGTYKTGKYVHTWIQVPGMEPYRTWDPGTPTFRDSKTVNYRGVRAVTLHSVIDNMVVSFHHMKQESGTRDRVSIVGLRMVFDEDGRLTTEEVTDKSELFFSMAVEQQDFGGWN